MGPRSLSAGLQLIEPVILAVQQRLQQDLPAELDITNGDYDDEVVLEPPAVVLDYIPAEEELVQFPMIGLLHRSGVFQDDIGSSATGVYDITIIAYLQHA